MSPEPRWFSHRAPGNSQTGCHRSEEHTSELQSRSDLVCRLLLEKKKKKYALQNRSEEHTSKLHPRTYIVDRLMLQKNTRIESTARISDDRCQLTHART